MVTTTRFATVEDLEGHGVPEGRWEVIDGELVPMSPTGKRHTRTVVGLIYRLGAHVIPHRLGDLLAPDSGVVLSERPLVIRVPDTGFIRADRVAADPDESGFYRVIPDLVVEVDSPSDRASAVIAKAHFWIEAGAKVVWSIDPDAQTVTVFTEEQRPLVLTIEDTLDGGPVLPEFRLPLRELFSAQPKES